jgi:hypothetical protein
MPIRRGALLLILLAGCVSSEPARPGVPWQSLKVGSDPGSIFLDVALVQRPLGDSFLTDQVWASADEMIVSAGQRELLELNGFRVGVLVGSPPEKLLQLLQSERSCRERRGRAAPSGSLLTQNLRECPTPLDGFLQLGKLKQELTLDRPRFGLDLSPTLKPNDAVLLRIVPRVEEGDKGVNIKAVPEEAAGLKWSLEMKRPTQVFAALGFEIELAPNQVLIIGPHLEREGSLGFHSLIDDRNGELVQRLLILRHMRSKSAASGSEPIEFVNPASPPLALQATGT